MCVVIAALFCLQASDAMKKPIGSICMWTLEGAIVSVDELLQLCDQHRLPDDYRPPPISKRQAFSKALDETKATSDGYVVKQKNNGPIVTAFVYKRTPEVIDLTCEIYFEKQSGEVTVDKQTSFAKTMLSYYTALSDYYVTVDFIRLLTANMGKLGGIQLRSKGGSYFIPPTPLLLKLRSVIGAIGKSRLSVYPVYRDPTTIEDLGREVKCAFQAEIQLLNQELDDFKNNPPRRDTLKRRISEVQQLAHKAQTYDQLLDLVVVGYDPGDHIRLLEQLLQQEEQRFAKKQQPKKRRKPFTKWIKKTK